MQSAASISATMKSKAPRAERERESQQKQKQKHAKSRDGTPKREAKRDGHNDHHASKLHPILEPLFPHQAGPNQAPGGKHKQPMMPPPPPPEYREGRKRQASGSGGAPPPPQDPMHMPHPGRGGARASAFMPPPSMGPPPPAWAPSPYGMSSEHVHQIAMATAAALGASPNPLGMYNQQRYMRAGGAHAAMFQHPMQATSGPPHMGMLPPRAIDFVMPGQFDGPPQFYNKPPQRMMPPIPMPPMPRPPPHQRQRRQHERPMSPLSAKGLSMPPASMACMMLEPPPFLQQQLMQQHKKLFVMGDMDTMEMEDFEEEQQQQEQKNEKDEHRRRGGDKSKRNKQQQPQMDGSQYSVDEEEHNHNGAGGRTRRTRSRQRRTSDAKSNATAVGGTPQSSGRRGGRVIRASARQQQRGQGNNRHTTTTDTTNAQDKPGGDGRHWQHGPDGDTKEHSNGSSNSNGGAQSRSATDVVVESVQVTNDGGALVVRRERAGHLDVRVVYSRDFILQCSASPFAVLPPVWLLRVCAELFSLMPSLPIRFDQHRYRLAYDPLLKMQQRRQPIPIRKAADEQQQQQQQPQSAN